METSKLVILGAGCPRDKGQPYALQNLLAGKNVLDWQLKMLKPLAADISFVGGYEIDDFVQKYPEFNYFYNATWQESGSIESLAVALEGMGSQLGTCDIYVIYSDILLRSDVVELLLNAEENAVSFLLDQSKDFNEVHQIETGELFSEAKGKFEFVGFIKIPAKLAKATYELLAVSRDTLKTKHLSKFIELLRESNTIKLTSLDAAGLWAHAEHSKSVSKFVLESKAKTLSNLKKYLTKSSILPLVYFDAKAWQEDKKSIIERTMTEFAGEDLLIVRSSAKDEDGFVKANAGKYHSELNVHNSSHGVEAAVEKVFDSYGGMNFEDEVLIQPQLSELKASGVLFTRQLATGAPYYVVNFVEGNDTTAITSGGGVKDAKVFISRDSSSEELVHLPSWLADLIAATREIEETVLYDALDIEFAILTNDQVVVLQCRPLMINDTAQDRSIDFHLRSTLKAVQTQLEDLNSPSYGVAGDYTIWSNMADWNPAEIVGPMPTPLALDLYRYIITDSTWAVQRREVGYRRVDYTPLVRRFAGKAFVDVRASLNSFVPATVSDIVARKLVNFGLDNLRLHPELHDKIEFEIIPTCMDFDFKKWRDRYADILNAAELDGYEADLTDVTRNIIDRTQKDVERAAYLETINVTEIAFGPSLAAEKIRHLLTFCRDEAALNFAHLARAGFVAISLMKSAVRIGALTEDRYHELLNSIVTVSGLMQKEAAKVKAGTLSKEAFVERFGHIRPGTYDVSVDAYKDCIDLYIDPFINAGELEEKDFAWTADERLHIAEGLERICLKLTPEELLQFVKNAIAGREYSKFVFTKFLSAAIDQIRQVTLSAGVSYDDAEGLSLHYILESSCQTSGKSDHDHALKRLIEERMSQQAHNSLIALPPVIASQADITAFFVPPTSANFITQKKIIAPLVLLDKDVVPTIEELRGKIVAINNADPGYDFLFSMEIVGLITGFGGPNSHMAIRAAEFALPAAIGIGEERMAVLDDELEIEIDCLRQRIMQQAK